MLCTACMHPVQLPYWVRLGGLELVSELRRKRAQPRVIQQAVALPAAGILWRSAALLLPAGHCTVARSVCLEASAHAHPCCAPKLRDACRAGAYALAATAVAVQWRKPRASQPECWHRTESVA